MSEKFDINIVTKAELASIPGIGEKVAEAIVQFRNKNGVIHDLHELAQSSRISYEHIENIRNWLAVTDKEPAG